jgi:hypothetical protein
MGERPKRIQRKRTKGWRMPEGAVYVGRPTRWGNPFLPHVAVETDFATNETAPQFVVDCFREWLGGTGCDWWQGLESAKRRSAVLTGLHELRGRDLACWCPLDQPCHADVLLQLANAEPGG